MKSIFLYDSNDSLDNISLLNMFKENKNILVGWTSSDITKDCEIIDDLVKDNIKCFIFSGVKNGWNDVIKYLKDKYNDIVVKVVCFVKESMLYDELIRNNFLTMLDLSKNGYIDNIGFFSRSQYDLYSSLGYKCSFLMEYFDDYQDAKIKDNKEKNKVIGICPLKYDWYKNIFNQICVGKMLDGYVVKYSNLNERMKDFIETMHIDNIEYDNEINSVNDIVDFLNEVDVVINTAFSDSFNLIYFISMHYGIPCLIGNNTFFFDDKDELKQYIVSSTEDNPIENAKLIDNIINNKNKINELYNLWFDKYLNKAKKSINDFIED